MSSAATQAAADARQSEEAGEGLSRSLSAESMVKTYVIAAVGAGIVPLPLLDVAAVAGIQLRMIQKLSEHYGKPFSAELGKSVITSLTGTLLGFGGGMVVASMLKFVPAVGWALGAAAVPVSAGAATYAIGKVFMKHYEDGGSLFDLDPKKLKAYYEQQFCKGKKLAEETHQQNEGGDTPAAV